MSPVSTGRSLGLCPPPPTGPSRPIDIYSQAACRSPAHKIRTPRSAPRPTTSYIEIQTMSRRNRCPAIARRLPRPNTPPGNTPRPSAAAGVGLVAHTLRRWRAARQLSKSRELQLNKDKRITAAHDVTKPAHTADVTTSNIPVTTLPPRLHQRRNHTNNLSSPTTTTLANIRPHDRTMPAGSSSMGEIF